jgi:hypothetical protein
LYASSHPQITVVFTAFRAHTIITTPVLPPAPQYTLLTLRFPACPPWRPCCLPLAQAILLELETEAEVILTPLIKLIIGETGAGRASAWVDEGAHDGDYGVPLYLIFGTLAYWWPRDPLYVYIYVQALQRCRVNAPCPAALRCLGNDSAAPPISTALKRLVTSRPALLGVSTQIHGMGVPASNPQSHLHGHHNLGSVAEMVVTAARQRVERSWDDWH